MWGYVIAHSKQMESEERREICLSERPGKSQERAEEIAPLQQYCVNYGPGTGKQEEEVKAKSFQTEKKEMNKSFKREKRS